MRIGAALALIGLADAAPTLLYQGTLQGGVSVDGSGVTTAYAGATWRAGDDLIVSVPAGATVSSLWLILLGQSAGWAVNPAPYVRLNGVPLTSAALLSSITRRRVYQLDPATFGVTGAGSYRYEEQDPADGGWHSAQGTAGAALIALYTHPSLPGRRHVIVGVDEITLGTTSLSGLPTAGMSATGTLSVAVIGECSDEQASSLYAGATLLSSTVGGRDDGGAAATSCNAQDWGSLITAGSFGYTDADAPAGLDGDSPTTEPAGAAANNSLRSDELYRFSYSGTGALNLSFYDYTGDARLEAFVVSIEGDEDGDGALDADDRCVHTADPAQADADNDGLGDACDPCTDRDGDGAGDPTTPGTCADDCDDGDPSRSPTAAEVWYDGTDSDCGGDDDYDQDRDGYRVLGLGDDCDDTDATIYAGAPDTWYDGVDSDCAGDDDYDQDRDGQPTLGAGDDCDDGDAAIYLGAPDAWYDGVDSDCGGDDDYDQDRDGHRVLGAGDDCDDGDGTIYAGAPDAWYDGVDADCAGDDDDDQDGDGHAVGWRGGDDCDDEDGWVYPGALELEDGRDNDCDGVVAEADSDGDGLSDGFEAEIGTDLQSADADGDGIDDPDELGDDPWHPRDSDADGRPDHADSDDDGDGLLSALEAGGCTEACPRDTDGDGAPDHLDDDSDGDGLPDRAEGASDSDLDGEMDARDPDDDGDGVPTAEELPAADTDGDGAPDHLDGDADGDGLPDGADPDRLTPAPDPVDSADSADPADSADSAPTGPGPDDPADTGAKPAEGCSTAGSGWLWLIAACAGWLRRPSRG